MIDYAVVMSPPHLAERLFGTRLEVLDRVAARRSAPVAASIHEVEKSVALDEIDVLVTGWGAPRLTVAELAAMPRLTAIVHAGGVASELLPRDSDRGIELSVAADVNGIPVAEYSLAMILLANKHVFAAARDYRESRAYIDREASYPHAGNYGQTVGVVGASRIGRRLIRLLAPFDLRVLVFDPYLSDTDARVLGVEVASLDRLLRESDAVSLHAPVTRETTGMIGVAELAAMKDGATLINTARGALVDADALKAELGSGRIGAILDVTDPDEPLSPDSMLWDAPNVFLTPHVAGSMGTELRRIGEHVAGELARIAAGLPVASPEVPLAR